LLALLVTGLVMDLAMPAPKLFLVHIRKGEKPEPEPFSEETTRVTVDEYFDYVDQDEVDSKSEISKESAMSSAPVDTENIDIEGEDYMIQSGFQPVGIFNSMSRVRRSQPREDGGDSDYVHEDDDASWHEFDEAQDDHNGDTVEEESFSAEADDYNYEGSETDEQEDVVADGGMAYGEADEYDYEGSETDEQEDVVADGGMAYGEADEYDYEGSETDEQEDVVADGGMAYGEADEYDYEGSETDEQEDVVADGGMAYGDGYELDEIDREIDNDIYGLYEGNDDENADDYDEEDPDAY